MNTEMRAKNINIEEFEGVKQFNEWKEKNPLYLIRDIQISNKIYVIFLKVNND